MTMIPIIWGRGRKEKNPDNARVLYPCARCNNIRAFFVLEHYSYGHLYGIRVAKWKATYSLACASCDLRLPIPTVEGFETAKQIAAVMDNAAASAAADLGRLVYRLARDVVQDPEMARLLRSQLEQG